MTKSKKDIPYLIKVNIPHDESVFEKMHLTTIHDDIENGYSISKHDFNIYCAILIRHNGIDSLPENIKDYCIQNGSLSDEIKFQVVRLEKNITGHLDQGNERFFWDF